MHVRSTRRLIIAEGQWRVLGGGLAGHTHFSHPTADRRPPPHIFIYSDATTCNGAGTVADDGSCTWDGHVDIAAGCIAPSEMSAGATPVSSPSPIPVGKVG